MTIPVGIANIYLGFVLRESPCTLCGYERFGMVVIATLGVLILRYGPHYKYIVTLMLSSFFFAYTAFRHWGGHIPRDLGQGFGGAMFGVHTYTWALFIFWFVFAAVAVGMIFVARSRTLHAELSGQVRPVKKFTTYTTVAVAIAFALTVTNAFQFLVTNGPPPFTGTGDPARMTLDVGRASQHWSADMYSRLGSASLHSFNAPEPHVPGVMENTGANFVSDPSEGPLAVTGQLELVDRTELGFDVSGMSGGGAAGIAYDESTGLFGFVSTDAGMFYVEDDLTTVVSRGLVDWVNGNDIDTTVDATFIGPNKLVAMASNKTIYGTERLIGQTVDEDEAWKEFRESSGDLEPLFGVKGRPMFQTARAKNAYALSIAGDTATESYYVVSVPHEGNADIIVSQFASDKLLSSEGILTASASAGLKPGADVGQYYPVGADFRDGTLFVLSKAYNSLLAINPSTYEVTDVYGLPDVGDPSDVVVTPEGVYVLARDGQTDVVYQLEGLN